MAGKRNRPITYIGEDAKPHNYIEKLLRYAEQTKVGNGVRHVKVLHDGWCGVFSGGVCNCHPIVRPLAGPPNS